MAKAKVGKEQNKASRRGKMGWNGVWNMVINYTITKVTYYTWNRAARKRGIVASNAPMWNGGCQAIVPFWERVGGRAQTGFPVCQRMPRAL